MYAIIGHHQFIGDETVKIRNGMKYESNYAREADMALR